MTPRRMVPLARRAVLIAALCVLIGLVTSCVTVPTDGPVRRVEGQQQTCRNCVDVEVAAPSPGDDPRQIVEGYLRATSNYQPNYSVAKQFLTKAAAEKWSPEDGAKIYRGSPTVNGDKVRLDALLIGTLDSHRSYTARDTRLHIDFKLTKEDGQWRIGAPPSGLMVAESSFTRFYSPYSVYFVGNGHLVPDAIYLPDLRSQSNIASVLMKALLAGPSAWLGPAVTSGIPPNTALIGDAVTTSDGIATVPLSDPVMQLDDQQRRMMAAQVVYTLREAVGIKGVLFTVNQQPLRVPDGDEVSFVVPADVIPRDLGPIPPVAGDQLYVVRNGAVAVVEADRNPPKAQPVLGDLGKGRYRVDSLAVSTANTDVAAVTNNRTALRWSRTATGEVHTVLSGARNLLRPQFSRFGELWALSGSGSDQRMWVITADKRIKVSAEKVLGAGEEVTAFRVSPDGARMALIRKSGDRAQLGLARISRAADKITVDGWRPLNTTQTDQPHLLRLQDVAWIDATDLLVIGSPFASVALQPFRMSQDASRMIAEGDSKWDARELAVLLPKQTVIAVDRNGQTYRDGGTEWTRLLSKVSTIAYPG
jgi:Lipoprotein LpqB beta-propeller domain/Sporulation and spore germination